MIASTTAVDSSLLISILKVQPDASVCVALLARCIFEGTVVISETAAAEVATLFDSEETFTAELGRLGITLEPSTLATCFTAGRIHREYRRNGGPREKMIPDFMIGAHALHQVDRLAATDRGYLRTYFQGLTVLQPA